MKVQYNPHCKDEILLPEGFRWVNPGELINVSDKYVFNDEWVKTENHGNKVFEMHIYIRPISPSGTIAFYD